MTEIGLEIEAQFIANKSDQDAAILKRYFKCASPDDYGYGDSFLGIRVPITRKIVNQYKRLCDIDTALYLTKSEWHEIRLAGFLFMIELFNRNIKLNNLISAKQIIDLYLSIIEQGNNWDLVDLIAPKLLGTWCLYDSNYFTELFNLSQTDNLWRQRVAIISTLPLIKALNFEPTLKIAQLYIKHHHDLIHKATGWMLREIGKQSISDLLQFLDRFHSIMPRTMLRYAIEHLNPDTRKHYLSKKTTTSSRLILISQKFK